MLLLLVASLLLTLGDAATTYLCLSAQSEVYAVWEANPVARWLFDTFGLVPGLMVDFVLSSALLFYLYAGSLYRRKIRGAVLGVYVGITLLAVVNNVYAMSTIGLFS